MSALQHTAAYRPSHNGAQGLLKRMRQWMGASAMAGKKAATIPDYATSLQRSYMVMPGQAVWMDRNYCQFAQEGYIKNVIANRSINLVAWSGASIRYIAYSIGVKGAKRELKQHPLLELLHKPSPQMGYSAFFQALYHYQMISGNAFVQSVGVKDQPPGELHLLRPDRMAVLAGKGTLPAGYRYTVNNQSADFPVDRYTGVSRVLHVKSFHPTSDWYGLSPIESAAYSIDQHNQSGAWNQALLQNGARPSGALVVKADKMGGANLSEDQYTRIKQQIDEQFTGAVNAGRPILLEGGLEWKEMSMTPRDMDFIEAKNASARDIALAFGVPPQLLGIPGDNTYSNLQEARLALWEQTVIPLVENTFDALSNWFQSLYNERIVIEPDFDNVPALATRNQALWDKVENASFLTEDEKRAAVGYSARNRASA
jgi:HK97 family phage portal protein